MGCWKRLQPAIREIRKELNKQIMAAAGRIVLSLQTKISDGKLTKQEARDLGTEALALCFAISTGAAEAAITVAVRVFIKGDETPEDVEADDDDAPDVE